VLLDNELKLHNVMGWFLLDSGEFGWLHGSGC